jgi:hypothetical protein
MHNISCCRVKIDSSPLLKFLSLSLWDYLHVLFHSVQQISKFKASGTPWPPFRIPAPCNPAYEDPRKLLCSRVFHAMVFVILYKAVYRQNVSEHAMALVIYLLEMAVESAEPFDQRSQVLFMFELNVCPFWLGLRVFGTTFTKITELLLSSVSGTPASQVHSRIIWLVWSYKKYKVGVGARGSAVSMVSDYGLGEQGSIPVQAKDFSSSLCIQTSSWGPPSLLYNGYRGSFPRA